MAYEESDDDLVPTLDSTEYVLRIMFVWYVHCRVGYHKPLRLPKCRQHVHRKLERDYVYTDIPNICIDILN